ncbi:MAG: FtsX-like permease family protein [Chitinophagaceae bacterium]|nr:MAG: FtsX-like permease family protein [Chitinophagaceae bacterium]
MAYQFGKKPGKRKSPTYIYSIVSISFVLFLLGSLGYLLFYANELGRYFKENVEVTVVLKQNISESDGLQLEKRLQAEDFVRIASYISPEKAAERLNEQLGEDFLDLLGYNPIFSSVEFYLTAEYANPDSIQMINEKLMLYREVSDVLVQQDLIVQVNENIRKIGIGLGIISVLLLIIALALIDNTLRLSMYSNRFIIKSMQLVGATKWFILKPFISRAILNGLLSIIITLIMLAALLYFVYIRVPELADLHNWTISALIFAVIFILGLFISVISTLGAVLKYLKMRLDDLY